MMINKQKHQSRKKGKSYVISNFSTQFNKSNAGNNNNNNSNKSSKDNNKRLINQK